MAMEETLGSREVVFMNKLAFQVQNAAAYISEGIVFCLDNIAELC